MYTNFKILLLSFLLLNLWGCDDHDHSADGSPGAEQHEGHDHGNEIEEGHDSNEAATDEAVITPEQMKMAEIETGIIEQKTLSGTVKINGVLKVPNEDRGVATSLFPGIIKTLLILPGSHVQKGQTVATIANADIVNIQQQYLENQARMTLALAEQKRQNMLVAGDAAPRKNLEKANAELSSLRSMQQALRSQMNLMGVKPGNISTTISIKSPTTGTVSHIYADIGSPVDASTPIAEIVNNRELHLDAFVYEQDLDKVKEGQQIEFVLTNNPNQKVHKASIFSIGTAFEKETKAIPIHAHVVSGTESLMDGMNVTGMLQVNQKHSPAVPVSAIVSFEGQDYILAQVAENTYKRVPVLRGNSDMGYVAISMLSPLPAGTRIITKGAFYVLATMTNKGEEGHAH